MNCISCVIAFLLLVAVPDPAQSGPLAVFPGAGQKSMEIEVSLESLGALEDPGIPEGSGDAGARAKNILMLRHTGQQAIPRVYPMDRHLSFFVKQGVPGGTLAAMGFGIEHNIPLPDAPSLECTNACTER